MKPFYVQVACAGADDVWGTITAHDELALAIGGGERQIVEPIIISTKAMMVVRGSVSSSTIDRGYTVTVYRTRPKGIRLTPWPKDVPIPEESSPDWTTRPNTTLSINEQIAHIEQYPEKFREHVGDDRTVKDYFDEYNAKFEEENGFGGLYVCLCADLEITPQ